MHEPGGRKLPSAVKIAAAALTLLVGRQILYKVMPTLAAGDPDAMSEVFTVLLMALTIWGLLNLQRWAWWLAMFASGAGWVLSGVIAGVLNVPELAAEFWSQVPDRTVVVQQLSLIGGASFVAFFALMTPSGREPFRG